MLHKETVTPATLDLIYTLQRDVLLSDFFLVGGTALSLQIGHRISNDIDFFTRESFDPASWPNLVIEQALTLKEIKSTIIHHCNNYLAEK